ncbi:MAG: CFI-box-CTERM domain-containing protein [Candidatus Eremiobacterota bacterium]
MRALLLVWLLSLAASAQPADSDGDGLPDLWESNGVTLNEVLVDLPRMGANPLHKDLFVEVDYMQGAGHTHKPKPQALAALIQAFARAPVSNPDGRNGITLHVDAGAETLMNPLTGEKWGDLSQSDELGHRDHLGSGTRQTGYVWTEFLALKSANFKPERAAAFRYCIFCHNLGPGLGGTSGWARGIPGDDFVVSLGSWTGQVGTVIEQAGTFMHEMGHTLGLRHGGDENLHRKPNYLSVMNYNFQTRGLLRNRREGFLDYSAVRLPDLDEMDLNEPVGLNAGSLADGYGTRWLLRLNGRDRFFFVSDANGPTDWNANGVATDVGLSQDVNNDGDLTTLTGFADWPALRFAAGPIGSRSEVVEENLDEIDQLQDEEIPSPFEVGVDVTDDQDAAAGSTVGYTAVVTNLGDEPDTYLLQTASLQGWTDFTGVPTQVTLDPGESAGFPILVRIPVTAQPGQEEESQVSAESTANPDLVDGNLAITTVTAAVTPGLNTANPAGGGCFIATAAYGSYLDPHVVTLRRFRDRWLLPCAPGRALVAAYYRWSPPVADAIASSSALRLATVAALTPVVFGLEYPGVAVALLAAAGWLWRRRFSYGHLRRFKSR